jgi:undecaprenyl diphosphate synthase
LNKHFSEQGATATHVAIIMDGNGRWAMRRGLNRLAGHRQGVERVRDIVRACPDLGVRYLTLFAFSTENWKRSEAEVNGLMRLFKRYIRKESAKLVEEGVRVRFIGGRERLDSDLQALMASLEAASAGNDRFHLTVAINYGGRDELARAARRLAEDVAQGRLAAGDINEDLLAGHLDTADLPEPDLVIRTSGETRVSNFLLWQSAYSEFVFEDKCWPDYTAEDFAACIAGFGARERRFGAAVG